jgi:hypothetical protein
VTSLAASSVFEMMTGRGRATTGYIKTFCSQPAFRKDHRAPQPGKSLSACYGLVVAAKTLLIFHGHATKFSIVSSQFSKEQQTRFQGKRIALHYCLLII